MERYRKPTATLTLDAADIELLISVVSFASESETYASDDADLDRLYRRLERAGYRLLRKAP